MSYRLSLYCRPPRFRGSYGLNFVYGARRLLQEQSRRRCQAGRRLLFLLQRELKSLLRARIKDREFTLKSSLTSSLARSTPLRTLSLFVGTRGY